MKKIKINEFTKVAIAAVLSIALFSAVFVGVNSFVFAQATSGTETMPPATATINNPAAEIAPPEDYQAPELTVYIPDNALHTVNANAMTAEEAAQIGALYIWEMFGDSIDGKTVEMQYAVWPSHTRAYWQGTVAASRENMDSLEQYYPYYVPEEEYRPTFTFVICAVSGERIAIYRDSFSGGGIPMSKEVSDAVNALTYDERLALFSAPVEQPSSEELESYAQIVKEFAARHFLGTKVVSVNFQHAFATGSIDFDGSGKLVRTGCFMTFTVIDETGREGNIAITQGSKTPIGIRTEHNDILPGYWLHNDAPAPTPAPTSTR